MQLRKVLLVDDEKDIRTVGELSLSKVGNWETLIAASGSEALDSAQREQPDLILLDVMMPGLDGPETLRELRERQSTAHIPVIFMTAKVQKHEVEQYHELGALGVVAKPFDPMALPTDIQRIVDGR